jgi:hypothetical protein
MVNAAVLRYSAWILQYSALLLRCTMIYNHEGAEHIEWHSTQQRRGEKQLSEMRATANPTRRKLLREMR